MRVTKSFHHSILSAAVVLLASACSGEMAPSAPTPSRQGSSATPGDTAYTGGPGTTAGVPASAINLTVAVGSAVAGTDTLAGTPLANAHVRVLSQQLVRASGNTADTLVVEENEVAQGTTSADGEARFASLPAAPYRIEASSGDGSGGVASISIAPPFREDVHVHLILRAQHD